MVQEPGNPWRWKQNNNVFKFLHKTTLYWQHLGHFWLQKEYCWRNLKKKNNYYILAKNKNKNLSCKTPTSFWISKGYTISFNMLGSHGSMGFGSGLCKPSSQERTQLTSTRRCLRPITEEVLWSVWGACRPTVGRLEILKVRNHNKGDLESWDDVQALFYHNIPGPLIFYL